MSGTLTKLQQIQAVLGVKVDDQWGMISQTALQNEIRASQERLANKGQGQTPNAERPTPNVEVGEGARVDDRSEHSIATLHGRLQPRARDLIRVAAANGLVIKILSGLRTYAEQDALFRQGGVTKARGGYSNHNFGVAFDTGIFVDGKYIDDEVEHGRFKSAEMERLYTKLGALGKSLGLSWGGDWKSFQDQPHFELHPPWADGMSENEMLAELRRRHDNNIDAFA